MKKRIFFILIALTVVPVLNSSSDCNTECNSNKLRTWPRDYKLSDKTQQNANSLCQNANCACQWGNSCLGSVTNSGYSCSCG